MRINCEFDKAATIYENIISEFPEEAEAYWGLCLCNYGIEYVDDPATAKKIPTCHRASFESLQKDENYELALEYSDVMAQKVYRDEAREIDRIMNEILAVSKSEKPYDIFICYKETDEHGNRTVDSVLAYDIYEALTEKGYNVFFSRVTLEDKLGRQYEPYIFAALNSAKVMLSIGTKYEYFNAVWVKNEWSRFLKLMAKDRTKLLIPCYKDMDPYDMPDEFKGLQAQDMGKLGAMQDLLRGVEKILPKNKSVQTTKETVVVQQSSGNTTVESLLKRAFMFLEDSDWNSANEYCEKVLDLDPECAEAYLGKLMADLKVKNQGKLKDCSDPFDKNNNYQKAYRFGDNKLKDKLKADVDYINERNENTRKENALKDAKSKIAKNDLNQCKSALVLLESLKGFKDANEQIEKCKEKIKELEAKAEKYKKKTMTVAVSVLSAVIVVIAFIILLTSFIIPNGDYKKAVALMEDGKSEEAIAAFEELDGFKDSEEKILSIRYADAVALKEEGKTDEAIAAFEDLGDYEDSAEQIKAIQYGEAEKLAENKKTQDAIEAFEDLGDYKDSAQRAENLKFDYTMRKCKSAVVGSSVKFGTYEQDNDESNGKEDIEWKVLEKKGNRIFVVSKYALDFKQYNNLRTYATWDDCTLRTWMNEDFFNTAFSSKEQSVIPTVTVSAHKGYELENGGYGSGYKVNDNVSASTKDKVFILSGYELEKYFGVDNGGYVSGFSWEPTSYAMEQGVNEMVQAWLRSSDLKTDYADAIDDENHINSWANGALVSDNNLVCPAMWIELK